MSVHDEIQERMDERGVSRSQYAKENAQKLIQAADVLAEWAAYARERDGETEGVEDLTKLQERLRERAAELQAHAARKKIE